MYIHLIDRVKKFAEISPILLKEYLISSYFHTTQRDGETFFCKSAEAYPAYTFGERSTIARISKVCPKIMRELWGKITEANTKYFAQAL